MARSGSEEPRDVANLGRLESELSGLRAEAERQLAQAESEREAAKRDRGRASEERTQVRTEARSRRRQVGAGGEPEGRVPIDREQAGTERIAAAEERRAAAVQTRVRSQARAEELARREAERTARLPVLGGQQGFQFRQTAAQRIEADAGRVKQAIAQAQQAQVQAEAEAARARGAAAAARVDAAAQGRTPLQLGVGQYGPPRQPPRLPPVAAGGAGGEPPRGPGGGGGIRLNYAALDAEQRDAIDRAEAMTRAESGLSRELQYQARVLGLSSNAYQKHGYLTSEFIQAAARGQVTMREFGSQVGGTIAKFAGWTAAAASVYGALGAVNALGQGAIQAASGVSLLNRVVVNRGGISGDELQGRFSELSRKFNLPIEDVVQAVYGSTKAFKGDLPQALKASEQALFAVKVGELSAADSTRYLTAIVNGFRLTAKDLPAVFDALNQAQNRFGGSIQQNIAGVAKASGAFRLAGGSYRELIALIQTGVKVTGASGENVGTAIARSAGRVITPQGIEALRAAGLNPQQDYTHLLAQAFQEAQGASRERVRQIAGALVPSGGQFVRIFAPLLQNRQLYQSVFREISPDKAQGSARRELARALQAPDEQLRRLLGDVQRVGVELSRLGALGGPVAFIKGLDLALHELDRFLDLVDRLTSIAGPFKPYVVGALELAAALKLLRRFDLGGSLPVGRAGSAYEGFRGTLRRPEGDRLRAQTLQGLEDQRRFVEQERLRYGLQGAQLAGRRDNLKGVVGRELQGGNLEAAANAQLRLEAVMKEYQAAVEQEGFYRQAAVTTQEQINAVSAKNVRSIEELRAVMAAQGIQYVNPTLNRPTTRDPVHFNDQFGIAGAQQRAQQEADNAQRRAEESAARTRAAASAPNQFGIGAAAARAAAAQDELAKEQTATQRGMSRLGRSGTVLGAGLTAAKTTALGAAAGVRALGTGLLGFIRALGPLDIAILSFIGVEAALNALHEHQSKVKEAQGRLYSLTGGPAGVRQSLKDATHGPGFLGSIGAAVSDTYHQVTHPAELFNPRAKTPSEKDADARRRLAEQQGSLADRLAAYRAGGKVLTEDDVRARLNERLRSSTSAAERIRAFDAAIQEEEQGRVVLAGKIFGPKFRASAADQAKHRQFLADLREQRQRDLIAQNNLGPESQVAGLDLPHLLTYEQGTGQRLKLQGATGYNRDRVKAVLNRLRSFAGATSDEGIGGIAKVIEQANQDAQAIVDRYVAAHPSNEPGQQATIRLRGIAQARRALGLDTLRKRASDARASAEALTRNLDSTQAEMRSISAQATAEAGSRRPDDGPGPLTLRLRGLQNRADREKSRLHRARTLVNLLDQLISGIFGSLRQSAQEAADARYQANQELYDARTAQLVAQAEADTPGSGAQVQVRRDQNSPALRHYKKGSVGYIEARTKAIADRTAAAQAGDQASSDAFSRFQAQLENATARASIGASEGAKLSRAVSDAKRLEAYARGHGNAEQILQASTQVYSAEAAYVDYLRQQAIALIDAQQAYRLSGLDPSNRVAAARITLGADRRRVHFAQTPAERLQAKAQVRTDQQSYRDSRFEDVHDNIEFQLAMDRIDNDAAAAQLTALAQRVKHNKALKRQYLEEAHQLQKANQGSYELDLGSVRIPTPYEVTRAIKEGRRGNSQYRSSVVNQDNHTTINVEIGGDADIKKFAEVLDTHLATTTRSALRARGVI